VIDASIALAWCFPDEANDYADKVLSALNGCSILVPAIWGSEVANGVLSGERARRIQASEVLRFFGLLGSLSVTQDTLDPGDYANDVLPLARSHALSAYDVSYIELAARRRAALATLDGKMRKAAQAMAVTMFLHRK
jgi:predicted nucleic acid-binding protein